MGCKMGSGDVIQVWRYFDFSPAGSHFINCDVSPVLTVLQTVNSTSSAFKLPCFALLNI